MNSMPCECIQKRQEVELRSSSFVFHLNLSNGLRAKFWENRLTGQKLSMGMGSELEFDFDTAERRIWITGWKIMGSEKGYVPPNADTGYRKGYFRREFDDSQWYGTTIPVRVGNSGGYYVWTRTHVFLRKEDESKELAFVVGGLGLFDSRFMRVFINGKMIGTRFWKERWHEPGIFDLGPKSKARPFLRFGQDNLISLQMADPLCRTKRLDELDPQQSRLLPHLPTYPAQFEQYLVVGQSLLTPNLDVHDVRIQYKGRKARVVFELQAKETETRAHVTYEWDAEDPVLFKSVEIQNRSNQLTRLMHVRLGHYRTDATVSEGEQGFPVYLNNQFFLGLAHPSGWAIGQNGGVELRQYPGEIIAPHKRFQCMQMVMGVAEKKGARTAFLKHIQSRMRRVKRGHDRPYAIYESYGAWPIAKDEVLGVALNEKILTKNLQKIARLQEREKCSFDFYGICFWANNRGDLQELDFDRFPHGFKKIKPALKRIHMDLGLWIASSHSGWSIGFNPVNSPSLASDPAYLGAEFEKKKYLCRATDPAKTIFETAFCHHIRNNGAKLLKFDFLHGGCYHPHHEHLPGLYSTESIQNHVIQFFQALDRENPDVFLMLYWGYRSPWWLLHADTLFEPGLRVEAAHPSASPTLHARDSITQCLDQAQWWCEDVPPLGKDSLGVWLSDWAWNSSMGKERWQEGFVMDLCRGSLLAQSWDHQKGMGLSEWKQLALFIKLLKASPDCFANPRFILGNP